MNKFDKKIVQLLKADNSKTGVQVKDGNRVDIINEENKFIVEVRKIDNNKDAALHAIVDAADALVPPTSLDDYKAVVILHGENEQQLEAAGKQASTFVFFYGMPIRVFTCNSLDVENTLKEHTLDGGQRCAARWLTSWDKDSDPKQYSEERE